MVTKSLSEKALLDAAVAKFDDSIHVDGVADIVVYGDLGAFNGDFPELLRALENLAVITNARVDRWTHHLGGKRV